MIESYTEYFLIICRSVSDYVIIDFLDTIDPKIKMSQKFDIVQYKIDHKTGKIPLDHIESTKIVEFLKDYKTMIEKFEDDLLVKYFITLRNLTVHSIFPHIYENQHDRDKVLSRRFHRDFVSYLSLGEGGNLLLENGFHLKLNKSDEGSFFDKYPLSRLTSQERTTLEIMLKDRNPLELMQTYVEKIKNLIVYFEGKY